MFQIRRWPELARHLMLRFLKCRAGKKFYILFDQKTLVKKQQQFFGKVVDILKNYQNAVPFIYCYIILFIKTKKSAYFKRI